MYAKRRAVSAVISSIILILLISVTGSYLYAYSIEYFQKDNNRYIREIDLQSAQNQEQFKISYVWERQDFLNLTIYNYGKIDITISDIYVEGIPVNQYLFGISEEILTDSLHQIGFFSPINLVEGEVYEIKIVSEIGVSKNIYWESNFTA